VTYDPFARGDAPVGVMSREIHDSARDRTLLVEIWYPTTEAQRGRDVDAATQDQYDPVPSKPSWGVPLVPQAAVREAPLRDSGGRLPVVLFSHASGAHRRQSTHFCTHLASHGYVVASLDHIGNTFMDTMDFSSTPPVFVPVSLAIMKQLAADRPVDMSVLLDELLAGRLGIAAGRLDLQRVGMTGHSFGGWTTLVTTARDSRIVAALPLAPSGGRTPETNPINDVLADEPALDDGRPVPTLMLVAERDAVLPVENMRGLFERLSQPKRLLILHNAGHFFFGDGIESTHESMRAALAATTPMPPIAELCSPASADAFLRGMGTAHMDAHLKNMQPAIDLLASDLHAVLEPHEVKIEIVDD
jgi:dienelactone hydrolase